LQASYRFRRIASSAHWALQRKTRAQDCNKR